MTSLRESRLNPTLTARARSVDGDAVTSYDFDTTIPVAADVGAYSRGEVDELLDALLNGPALTGPRIDTIRDTNANVALEVWSGATSPVNWLRVDNAAAGGSPALSAIGTSLDIPITVTPKFTSGLPTFSIWANTAANVQIDAAGVGPNVGLNVNVLGTGRLQVDLVNVPTISSTDTLTNKSIDLTSNTLVGSVAEFNTALETEDFYTTNGTDVAVVDGGTGRSTGTTAYSLIATGTTATGAQQTLANGATTEILVGGGASALPVWTTATGSGAPVRATSPALTTPNIGTPSAGTLTNCTGLPVAGITSSTSTALGVGSLELGHATDTTLARSGSGDVTIEGNVIYRAGGTDVPVTDGGTGRSTSTTAYGLIAAGTTATGAQQTLAAGATTEVLVGGGASALPVWTTATGTGAPARAGSPTFTGTAGFAALTASGNGVFGTATTGGTATPTTLHLTNNYGTNTAGNAGNLKLLVYDNFGLGMSATMLEVQAQGAKNIGFFHGGTQSLLLTESGGVTTGTFAGALSVSGTTATISSGANTPEGAVTAVVGSLFLRTNGGASTTLYIKESGSGNTGWRAV